MAAASALFKKTQNKAGLALHEDDLRYIELEGNLSRLRVAKKVSVPSGGKGIRKNSLADAGDLLAALQALGSSIGGFKVPVAMSIPSRDILIRVIEMPELEMNDAREASLWDFEKYFPFAYSDAAGDISKAFIPPSSVVPLQPQKTGVRLEGLLPSVYNPVQERRRRRRNLLCAR